MCSLFQNHYVELAECGNFVVTWSVQEFQVVTWSVQDIPAQSSVIMWSHWSQQNEA